MLSDEEKKTIDKLKNGKKYTLVEIIRVFKKEGIENFRITRKEYLDIILNLLEKQDNRIKELEQENREIREWKYVIDNPIDLEKLKELDLIKIKGKEYISKDRIKAKIEYYEKIDNSVGKIVLQSLLKEEE